MTEDNKKRIFIREVENPCADCENKGCNICNCGEIWKAAIPRSEAIEKIAKAICRIDGEDCETCGFNGNEKGCKKYLEIGNYITYAETALNALLEEK